jgi:hypothetical protein
VKVKAIVRLNSGLALVLDRMPEFKYVKKNGLLYAKDHGFYKCFYYEKPGRAFKAFGGAKFDLPLVGGGVEHCNGQWWDGANDKVSKLENTTIIGAAISTIERLKNCYVFSGAYIDKAVYDYLIETYKGEIYGYWDYEKVIKYDDLRKKYFRQQTYFDRAKQHLINNVRRSHAV